MGLNCKLMVKKTKQFFRFLCPLAVYIDVMNYFNPSIVSGKTSIHGLSIDFPHQVFSGKSGTSGHL